MVARTHCSAWPGGHSANALTSNRHNKDIPAFHNLLVKLRLAVTLSRFKFRSCPALVPATATAESSPLLSCPSYAFVMQLEPNCEPCKQLHEPSHKAAILLPCTVYTPCFCEAEGQLYACRAAALALPQPPLPLALLSWGHRWCLSTAPLPLHSPAGAHHAVPMVPPCCHLVLTLPLP